MANVDVYPGFENFDDLSVYKRYEAAISDNDTLNMVVEFDSARASSALNIDNPAMSLVLGTKGIDSQPLGHRRTRWIIIWGPELQKDVVMTLGKHYGFSPRLLLVMCSDHAKPSTSVVVENPQKSSLSSIMHRQQDDIEMASPPMLGASEPESEPESELNLNYYQFVNEVWHFCSVDWGSRYICVGYNSICNPQPDDLSLADEEKKGHLGDKPLGVRYWTWLIMGNDGTIISIHENPFPHHQGKLSKKQVKALKLMRRNLRNIFRQLSRANVERNPLMSIPIRPLPPNVASKGTSPSDAPSLLFHYLFDDWMNTHSLVARKEHQYGVKLEQLRERLFSKPEVQLIEDLHRIGRQLAVLKRMYESYALIIERILDRQKPMSRSPTELSDPVNRGELLKIDQSYGVSLSPAAVVRFERLRDRIKLYALSEIQDCLEDKESLVFLNFNLITLKEAQAVERLTRITILLAKLTILFLPVSLMTGYFSIQMVQSRYTLATYWGSFGVIMGASLLFLIAFGGLSGTLEGRPIYKSMTRTFIDFSRDAIGKRRKRT